MTDVVDPGFADWLRARARFVSIDDAVVAGAWGLDAVESEIVSPLTELADAQAEGARQMAFLGKAAAIDTHIVPGLRADLFGRTITLTIDKLGYLAGVACFVIGAEEGDGVTALTVVRRL